MDGPYIQYYWCPYKTREIWTQIHMSTGGKASESHVQRAAERGVMPIYKPRMPKTASNHKKLGEEERSGTSLKASKRNQSANTWFWTYSLLNLISVILSHLLCDNL